MATIHMARPTSPYTSSSSDTDSIIASVPSGTALRRLYFKTAKTSKMSNTAQHKNSSTVPKVIVMNSSCNSTINTSTESASTHLTNITTTTDTETCDSLDLGDGDIIEQREPLLSESQDDSLTLSGHQDSSSTMEDDKNTIIINANDDLEESITPLLGDDGENSRKEQILNARKYSILYPHTAPPLGQTTTESSFSFDPPPSPRSARSAEKSTTLFSFDPVAMVPSNELSAGNKSSTRTNVENKENVRESDMNKVSKNTNKTEIKRERRFSTKCELFTNIFSIKDSSSTANKEKNSDMSTKTSKKTNSAPVHRKNSSISQSKFDTDESSSTGGTTSDLTMFPFDREAIDYERIQRECFAVEEEFNNDAFIAKSSFPYDYDTEDSPSYEALDQQEGIFQQYAILSQQEKERQNKKREQSPAEMKTLSKIDHINRKLNETSALIHEQPSSGATSPIPDLKIDFFSEPSVLVKTLSTFPRENENKNSDALDRCQKDSTSSFSSKSSNTNTTKSTNNGSINLTSNPMSTAVCTTPRATIVVQQASLSLDYSVETVLLKNECDFISVEQGKESSRKKKQRDENIRQLLDVTNKTTLTTEEMRDFEMRYGSPHHTRSQSVKMPGSRASGRPNQLCLPQQRSRVASMPNTGVEEEYYRLRHFSITGKGIVNRGDSLKSRRSKSNNSVASSNSSTEHLTTAANVGDSARTSLASSRESSTSAQGSQIPYRVLMLGSEKVGKSSLVSQFMTSEYLHAYDTSIDDDSGEKSVSVLLSGEESEMTFIDHAYNEMTPENCLSSYDPHGFLVIYSSADKTSFSVAERILQALWTGENIAQKAVILVGNKADLARSRCVSSEEGKAMATAYDCKFIETSVGINHNVDELLVGLLTQIRLKLENPEKSRDLFRKRSYRKSKRRACSPLGTTCLSGNTGTNPSTPVGPCIIDTSTPPNSIQNSPRKYRGSRTSASLKVKGLLGRVWARDSKSKSCENLHVL
ncbi:CLUMA_CG019466, isoform B [Clunio marinus]|uniref:CLUMA_CG019466, isoform B n=1 Tax=Clunio marinus TaxID=568069 RepID=A0A1J1J4Y3_9DIPT|nr:CLUMA_CG019466, isoform B [Clunio marinus]